MLPGLYAFVIFSSLWPYILGSLAIVLVISGIEDLVPILICGVHTLLRRKPSSPAAPPDPAKQERRIAIFVPCWKESQVIGNMVRHNLAAIRYRNYDFFLGAYPNDPATMGVVESLSADYGNVHVSVCPHPGPTSKADCLNWIYSRML